MFRELNSFLKFTQETHQRVVYVLWISSYLSKKEKILLKDILKITMPTIFHKGV